MTARSVLKASCACGQVELEARGAPIVAVVCYCDDCQAAGRQIEGLPAAPRVLDPDAGTSLVVYRKDRLRCVRGEERLTPHKLKPESATSRYVASCCNSALYLGFDDAKHWVDVFRDRIEGPAPAVQMRLCTRYRPTGTDLPDDAPAYPGFPFALIARFIRAKLAMTFGR
jgi:hypothetical protein